MLQSDLHTHSIASGHAFNTVDELARAAKRKRISVLGITDHGPSMEGAPTPGYFEMVDRLPAKIHGIVVLMGCEANVIDTQGHLDLHEPYITFQKLLLVGLHRRTPYPEVASVEENTTALIKAMENHRVHIVAHPYRSVYPIDVTAVVDAACKHDTLLEVNASVFRRVFASSPSPFDDPTMAHTRTMIQLLRSRGRGFVLNSDAHFTSELGIDEALMRDLQRTLEFSMDDVVNASPSSMRGYVPALGDVST